MSKPTPVVAYGRVSPGVYVPLLADADGTLHGVGGGGGGSSDASAANQLLEIADLDKLAAQLVDGDTGAGTAQLPLFGFGLPKSGGPVAGGTVADPINIALPSATVTALTPPANTGYATGAKQDTGNTSVASIDTKTPALGQALAAGAVPVVLTAIQAAALTPPAAITGFATSAKQDTGNTSVASIDTKTPALGQALAAAAVPVVLTAIQVTALTPPTTVAATQSGAWALTANQSVNLTQINGTTLVRVPVEPRVISVTGAALTRAANTTAYTALDAVSDNATPGSVTAKSVSLSDTNDDPISIEEIQLATTDTGFGGKSMRIYLYNSDPTASSGVVGGDNLAFSNKQAGFIGSMVGTFLPFSDGAKGRFVPEAGVRILTTPASGAKTIFWQLQTLDNATPSGNSTTFTPTFRAFQGRAV